MILLPCPGINHLEGRRSQIRILSVGGIPLEKDAKQLVRRNRNNHKKRTSHANHKHPTQAVSDNLEQEREHIHHPNTSEAFYSPAMPRLSITQRLGSEVY